MKKIILVIILLLIAATFLGLVARQLLILSSNHISSRLTRKILWDDYITDNQKKIDILHYNLEFDLYPEEKKMIAVAEIKGRILQEPLNSIDMNFYDNFLMKEVLLNGVKSLYILEETSLSIPVQADISDTFVIKISYEGTPEKSGLAGFVFGKRDGYSLVYTLSEPTYASSWFPCNDIPNDKTLMDIKITNDSSMISVSNGILVSEEVKGSRKTYHWKTIYPISTYLIALYSADYEMFADRYVSLDGQDTMKISYYVLPDKLEKAKIDFADHSDIIRYFAETFGEYPFIKEKYGVAEFLWMSGAMENQTITGVSSNLIGGKKFFNDYFIHEVAHHWWGNAVGLKSWNDIWLNEGFSSYSEALYFEFRDGSNALQSTMHDKYSDNFSGRLSEPGSFLFTNTVYNKGAWVLHMLRWEVGDSTFFKILREYYRQYKFSNASTEDFKEICEEVSTKKLDKFFNQWIEGEGEIELQCEYNTIKEDNNYVTKVMLEQVQEEYQYYDFPIELLLEFDGQETEFYRFRMNSKRTLFEVKTPTKPLSIEFDPNGWLLATITEK